jgi:hypothetical protein
MSLFWSPQWHTKAQNKNKNQREENNPPPPIARYFAGAQEAKKNKFLIYFSGFVFQIFPILEYVGMYLV